MTVRQMGELLEEFQSKKTLPEIENWRINDLIETLSYWITTFQGTIGDATSMWTALNGMSTTLTQLQTYTTSLLNRMSAVEAKTKIVQTMSKVVGANGLLTVYLTDNGAQNGNPLYTNIESVLFRAVETDSPHTFSDITIAGDKKSLTATVKKSSGINVSLLSLTLLGAPAAATGSTVYTTVIGT